MADHLSSKNLTSPVDQILLRGGTGNIVSKEDIAAVNSEMVEWSNAARALKMVLIDTHQVTLESYGFRVAPFNEQELRLLGITDVLLLVAPDEIVVSRIEAKHGGRRVPSLFQAKIHAESQLQVAISYSVLAGVEARIIEAQAELSDVVVMVERALNLEQSG